MDPLLFLTKHRREIHESLNYLWKIAAELREAFSREYRTSEITPAFNSYILLNGKWSKRKYPLPSFRFSIGEVSVNLGFVSAVIGVYSRSLNEEFLEAIIEYTDIEIYGGRNFLHTFYEGSMKVSPKDLLRDILKSGEETVQLEVKIDHAQRFRLLKEVKNLHELMYRNGIKAVQALHSPA